MDGQCAARLHRPVHRELFANIAAIRSMSEIRTGYAIDTGKLHDVLDKYGIANSFEVYPGTHTSTVADRFQNHVMPFFSQNLCSESSCR